MRPKKAERVARLRAWGERIRAQWLPEAVDPRPWRSRGVAVDGVRWPVIEVVRPDLYAEARRLRALRKASPAVLTAIDYLGSRETTTAPGEWTNQDEDILRRLSYCWPLEMIAAALAREPSDVRARAELLGVDVGGLLLVSVTTAAAWRELPASDEGASRRMADYYTGPDGRRRHRTLHAGTVERGPASIVIDDELERIALRHLDVPAESFSLNDAARVAGITAEGARKAFARLGIEAAIPRRRRKRDGTFTRGMVALNASAYTAPMVWQLVAAVERERVRRTAARPTCTLCGERPATRNKPLCVTCSARERKRLSRRSQAG